MTNTADERRANLLEKVTAYISKHTINDVTSDDEAFFFGLNYNENGELDIGDGTKEQHCNIMCTSKYYKQTISLVDSQCFKNCSCSCIHFLKKTVCHHVVAYSLSINADWYGIKYRQKSSFEAKIKKGAPKRLHTGRYSKAGPALSMQ